MKTDILREVMYFSYDKFSQANMFPLSAIEVREILKMNRDGIKPESLKSEPEAVAPEFVTAVGDDSISRFDNVGRRRKKSRGGRYQGGNGGQNGSDRGNGDRGNGDRGNGDRGNGEQRGWGRNRNRGNNQNQNKEQNGNGKGQAPKVQGE